MTARRRPGSAGSGPPSRGERVRRRLAARPEIELTPEEERALADDGIDPDDVRRLATDRPDEPDASEHDRDTARDELEGLAFEADEDH